MSDEARAYVRARSPFSTTTFWVHYVVATLATPPDYEFDLDDANLANQWPFSRRAVQRARAELAERGFLTVLVEGRRYRFEFPEVPVVRQIGGTTPLPPPVPPPNPPRAQLELAGGESEGGRRAKSGGRRATPFPSGRFVVTAAMREWLRENDLGHLAVRPETERFRDYHLAKGSTFKDWEAAWRNWMRNAAKFAAANGTRPTPTTSITDAVPKPQGFTYDKGGS